MGEVEEQSPGREPAITASVPTQQREEGRPIHSGLGERVAGVLNAAEEVAEQIRADAREEAAAITRGAEEAAAAHLREVAAEADRLREEARHYAEDVKQTGESFATRQRREAEAEVAGMLADAEAEARATRETAEEMGKRIEGAAHERRQRINTETREVEDRLHRTVAGLRELTAQLENLRARWTEPREEESLVQALGVEGRQKAPD